MDRGQVDANRAAANAGAGAGFPDIRSFRLKVALPFYLVHLGLWAFALSMWSLAILDVRFTFFGQVYYGYIIYSDLFPWTMVSLSLIILLLCFSVLLKHGEVLTVTARVLKYMIKEHDPVVVAITVPLFIFWFLIIADGLVVPFLIPTFLIRTNDAKNERNIALVARQEQALDAVVVSKPMLVVDKQILLSMDASTSFQSISNKLFSPTTGDKIVFISHKWCSADNWDTGDGRILSLIHADCKKDPDDCCYWIDIFCIPPSQDWSLKVQWIKNIPNFIDVCTDIRYYSLTVEPMLSSAWCLYELLSQKEITKQSLGKVQIQVKTPSGTEKIAPRLRMVRAQNLDELREVLHLCGQRLLSKGYTEGEITNWIKSCEELQIQNDMA